jgi:hypothetical protein
LQNNPTHTLCIAITAASYAKIKSSLLRYHLHHQVQQRTLQHRHKKQRLSNKRQAQTLFIATKAKASQKNRIAFATIPSASCNATFGFGNVTESTQHSNQNSKKKITTSKMNKTNVFSAAETAVKGMAKIATAISKQMTGKSTTIQQTK